VIDTIVRESLWMAGPPAHLLDGGDTDTGNSEKVSHSQVRGKLNGSGHRGLSGGWPQRDDDLMIGRDATDEADLREDRLARVEERVYPRLGPAISRASQLFYARDDHGGEVSF